MIPQSLPKIIPAPWQTALQNAVSDPVELLQRLQLSDQLQSMPAEHLKNFPLRVPESYIAKMTVGDAADPLLRQVFPLLAEQDEVSGFSHDPVGDMLAVKTPGILHKYHGRALLVVTGACAIHCRYCFRRHFPYNDSNPLASQWQQTLAAIREDTSLSEVIFSGGDPLALTDKKLSQLVADLEKIPHLKRLRIHTRLPVVLPERIDKSCLEWLATTRLKTVMVIHANHANEIDASAANALLQIKQAGCQLLNQAVLLKGVNDSVAALSALSERLNEVDVMPYYLHLLDRVAGASHFEVDEPTAIGFMQALRTRLPGYLVPRLVREEQGKPSKTIVF